MNIILDVIMQAPLD